ncbi:MAG: glycosyltransferase, partial [candidate division WOR-3 bacterium]
MKIIMDFRKYDSVIGGVEQGAIQITRYVCERGEQVLLVCKERRLVQVEDLFGELDGLKIVTVPVQSHLMSLENAKIDSGFLQDLAEKENADLIHFFYNWSFPFKKKIPSLLTVHDVIPFTFREAMGFWRNRFLYRPSLRIACKLNDAIATV